MRRVRVIVLAVGSALVAALAVAGCTGADSRETADDQAAVVEEAEATVASLFEAMNAADGEAVLDQYSEDDFSRVSCTQMQDRAFFGQVVQSYYRSRDSLSFEYEVAASTALGPDAAVVSASGGSPDVDGLFWTWVLHREAGELRIVHEHESWTDCPPPRRSTFHGDVGGMGAMPAPDTGS